MQERIAACANGRTCTPLSVSMGVCRTAQASNWVPAELDAHGTQSSVHGACMGRAPVLLCTCRTVGGWDCARTTVCTRNAVCAQQYVHATVGPANCMGVGMCVRANAPI